jgi:hypothetical protein
MPPNDRDGKNWDKPGKLEGPVKANAGEQRPTYGKPESGRGSIEVGNRKPLSRQVGRDVKR